MCFGTNAKISKYISVLKGASRKRRETWSETRRERKEATLNTKNERRKAHVEELEMDSNRERKRIQTLRVKWMLIFP